MVVVAGFGVGGGVASAQAQETPSTCTTSGTVALTGIPPVGADLVPSQGRLIAGYGRSAKSGGCKISLVCIATDGSDPAREVARQQCVVVRDRLVRSGFTKADISTSRQNPGNGMTAGTVYFSAY
jgi:hypothetical protein